ncbi:hypothetical protein B0O80DRAFT_459307 [Mortierella sp. GBAus27b]|nr:hypothetical protein BGX31_001592 [Mortierella sp. GBA43]KAI8349779.1 hypothetical protein B0O80DRAFT_459307 [Mortierella sp. GBAus27b]
MTVESSHSLQDLSSTSPSNASHGLMLVRIADYDAPLEDVFHAIKRALALVHRLTIVLSVDPPLETTSSITAEDAAVPGARQANSWDSNSDDSSDRHNRYSHDSDRSMDPNGMSSSSSLSSIAPSSFHSVQRLLSALYVSFTKQALALQRPLAELDIVFRESCGYPIGVGVEDQIPFDVFLGMPDAVKDLEELNRTRSKHNQTTLPIFSLDLTPETEVDTHLVEAIDSSLPYTHVQEGQYQDVALGGTFDHLHAGHKILLSMTAWITSHRVVCGVTDDSMLKSKKFGQFMEPLDKRIATVERFLRAFKRGLVYEVVPIHDIYGPTITDDKLQALMVSKETLKGGAAVNEERGNRNLSPLKIEVINVISPTETHVDEVSLKISSTFIRQYLSEQYQARLQGNQANTGMATAN